ncbi:hypothetical protein BC830DRAFT_1121758 [Chytriomyces sp. MP71]|nr:hypothetical protein BC830DRAFT_1121758 [Chytriomyces sp. MP71]
MATPLGDSVPGEDFLASRTVVEDPSGAMYNWAQVEDGVLLSFRVGASVTTEEVVVDASEDTVCVRVRGKTVLRGRLFATIDAREVKVLVRSVSLDELGDALAGRPVTDGSEHQRRQNPFFAIAIVRLAKRTAKHNWQLAIQGGIENSTDTDPYSLYLIANALNLTNDPAALKLMNTAAEKGSIAAMLKLAAWYEIGREEMPEIPVAKNEDLALLWHKRAGHAGNAEACYILMTTHASGSHKAEKNFVQALQWSRAALQSGFGDADDGGAMAMEQPRLYQTVLFQTGLLLMEGGSGIGEPNPMGAVAAWRTAAEEGHAQSSWNLGIFCLNGFGLPEPDVSLGVALIRSGMKKVKELSLPPQLSGMSEKDIDALVEMDAHLKSQGSMLDVEKVKVMMQMNKNGQLSPALGKPSAPAKSASDSSNSTSHAPVNKGKEETIKRNNRRREKERLKKLQEKASDEQKVTMERGVDWNLAARKSFAVAIIGVGLFGLFRAFKMSNSSA